MAVETMMREKLSYKEVARLFEIPCDKRVADWERIYLTEGAGGLYIERRGRSSKSRPQQFHQKVEEDLLAEVQRRLNKLLNALSKVKLLIVDELSYLTFNRNQVGAAVPGDLGAV